MEATFQHQEPGEPRLAVVVPTLEGGSRLLECVVSLTKQTETGIDIIVVDNSGAGLARRACGNVVGVRIVENPHNVGFGAAVNHGWRTTRAPFLACLNDDAIAFPDWAAALLKTAVENPRCGMVACQVRLAGTTVLDSAGLLLARDGSSKQRGHGRPSTEFEKPEPVLAPSGSAALYRRVMLEEVGLFSEEFFLYCEDTDLALRARWAGWNCLYTPQAVVEHHYSATAGRASEKKAYLVERNRLRLVVRTLPFVWMLTAPLYALARYFWHILFLFQKRGKAAEFREGGKSAWLLPLMVLRAHWDLLRSLPTLLAQRATIARTRKVSTAEFRALAQRNSVGVRQVAAL